MVDYIPGSPPKFGGCQYGASTKRYSFITLFTFSLIEIDV